jgi:predicted short-subunit dehydrogenase-like oxidoreductase (DUF2520 family)
MAGRNETSRLDTSGQSLLLLAVPDAALAAVAAALAARPQAAVALHTAGSLDAEVLAPLRAAGIAVGSVHPLKAFPEPLRDPGQARGVFFAVDGDPPARALAFRLAAAWEADAAEVPAAARTLYHFAATLAAGGVVTLLAAAEEIARRLALPDAVVRGYLELSRGAVAAAAAAHDAGRPVSDALTGPAARGDRATVEHQLAALGELAPEKLPLVRDLVRETLRQKELAGELSAEQRELLASLVR